VAEWLKAADCKSARFSVRWFESSPVHQYIISNSSGCLESRDPLLPKLTGSDVGGKMSFADRKGSCLQLQHLECHVYSVVVATSRPAIKRRAKKLVVRLSLLTDKSVQQCLIVDKHNMKRRSLKNFIVVLAAGATACGGGGGTGSGGGGTVTVPPTATTPPSPPPPTTTACSLRNRQDFASSVLNEWYLFPETLPAALDPTPFTTVQAYIDALVATARGQGRDRFFTYITSIAEENAFFSSGATAGFGVRFAYQSNRLFVTEAFEGAPALAAGIDRGTEVLAIGTSTSNLVTVAEILASQGATGVTAALGPSTAGTARVLRVSNATGTQDVTVTKATFNIDPLSSRYGNKVIDNGAQRVGYINMRTFISTADNQLRSAFEDFRAQGITNFVIDFRYNGGGLVSTAELMGDLMGGNRFSSDVFTVTRFRPSKSSNNETKRFVVQAQSVSPVKIAFISTGATASASELVMNSFIPFLGANTALIGANSFGKPVGQIAVDQTSCDDRIRVVAFAKDNAAGQGDYFSGLASNFRTTCAAADDITKPLGDPQEASLRTALDFVAGRSCTPVSVGQSAQSAASSNVRRLLPLPQDPSIAQREVPGAF
jgi:carboxyl-terminal processing protease